MESERADSGLIRNFGTFWRVSPDGKSVNLHGRLRNDRRTGREAGRLSTIPHFEDLVSTQPQPAVNFARQSGIYILYNDYGPRYIGKSWRNDLGGRLKDHLTDAHAGKWNRFSWFGFWLVVPRGRRWEVDTGDAESVRIEARGALRDLETLLIRGFGLSNVRLGHFTGALEWTQSSGPNEGIP